MKGNRAFAITSRVLIKNIVTKTYKLKGHLFNLFLASILYIDKAQADGYMNCWVEPTSRNVQLFPQTFSDMGTIYYWGYRSQEGDGGKGMFTSFGMKGFAFSELPSTPRTMTIEHNHDDMIEWTLRRNSDPKSTDPKEAWGGIHIWMLKIVDHKKNEIRNNIELQCEESSGTPKRPKASDSYLTKES